MATRGDAGAPPSGCPETIAMHATLTFTAASYQQAVMRGADNCPNVPSK
jgi:hypothetical protein